MASAYSCAFASRSRSLLAASTSNILKAGPSSLAASPGRSRVRVRHYAQVGSTTYLGVPPAPPGLTPPPRSNGSSTSTSNTTSNNPATRSVRPFDAQVVVELRARAAQPTSSTHPASPAPTPLPELVEQYMKRAGHVLDVSLPYESRPGAERRVRFSDADVDAHGESSADGALVMVAHAVHDRTGKHKITYSSGFYVNVNAPGGGNGEGESVLVTCAHTLEEIRHDPLLRAARPTLSPAQPTDQLLSGSFIISGHPPTPVFRPVTAVLSAMHRGDVLLLSAPNAGGVRSLPVNPYPVQPGARVRAHFVTDKLPPGSEGWTPWLGGTWRKWVRGSVVGYRDYAGREAKPGTYDSLAHLHFEPPPTAGSSGGPIIDEESGSVIGVILGTQLVSQVEGVRGWGVPSEMIFEMFSLPGMKLNKNKS